MFTFIKFHMCFLVFTESRRFRTCHFVTRAYRHFLYYCSMYEFPMKVCTLCRVRVEGRDIVFQSIWSILRGCALLTPFRSVLLFEISSKRICLVRGMKKGPGLLKRPLAGDPAPSAPPRKGVRRFWLPAVQMAKLSSVLLTASAASQAHP